MVKIVVKFKILKGVEEEYLEALKKHTCDQTGAGLP